jgi:hypothetical protein
MKTAKIPRAQKLAIHREHYLELLRSKKIANAKVRHLICSHVGKLTYAIGLPSPE